ncbi:MAG: sulfite exporter TauE/SafE family protein [Nanoarchaeota archaeon]|jgi:sulfite exporter TauE/SafE/copper chaperone CopZ|nr:sulfite exporter TauE/SafE family protein [Nanoarchaeota archaeon]
MKEIFNVEGMTCNNCVSHIEDALKDKVDSVKANYIKGTAEVEYHSGKISRDQIVKKIEDAGYIVKEKKFDEKESVNKKDSSDKISFNVDWNKTMGWAIVILGILGVAYFLYGFLGDMNLSLPEMGQKTSLFLLFLVGILTGFHCVSMCGGFMISYTAKNAAKGNKGMGQHLVYGTSKTISYTIIGGLFGLIGSIFLFTPALRGGIGIFAGLFMVAYALSMFGFKFFRRFQFNPKFLRKVTSKKYEGKYKGPMMTGLLNGLFIACGPLQAMYIYAAGTGSVAQGALSLFAFGLGTLPVLIGFGGLANVISHKATRKILKFSAVIVLILGLIMLNRGLSLTGSGYDVKSIMAGVGTAGVTGNFVMDNDGYQVIHMDVTADGYSPDSFVLKKGVPVRWVIDGKQLTGCNNAIQVPSMGLEFKLKEGLQTIEFTPTEEGVISWSCWMGMIPGTFVVTNDGEATETQVQAAVPKASGGCGCGG